MTEPGERVVDEFQRRNQVFQSEWTRTFLRLGVPGLLLFFVSLLVVGPWGLGLTLAGFSLFAGALARGAWLIHRSRRCPVCDEVQGTEARIPHRTCGGCGTRHSRGVWDSA
jgi:hypothetical protein